MVVNTLIHNLMEAGFSEYEARAYIALVRENPLTAYEIAREAGIPTAKIYGVVSRLAQKGVFSVTGEGKGKRYMPMDTQDFVEGLRGRIHTTLTQIEGGLSGITRKSGASGILNLQGYDYIIDKAQRLITGTRRTLLVSVWQQDIKELRPALKKAENRHIQTAIVHFGAPEARAGLVFHHPTDSTAYGENGGRGLVVVADSLEALTATVTEDGTAEGATSTNRGFVSLAEEYIKHDIYMMKLVRRFDRDFKRMFGQGYEKLRDVFSDEARL